MPNINQFIQFKSIPTATPGVNMQVLQAVQGAPQEVVNAVAFAQSQNMNYGGNINPDQLAKMVAQQLGPTWSATDGGEAYAPVNLATAGQQTQLGSNPSAGGNPSTGFSALQPSVTANQPNYGATTANTATQNPGVTASPTQTLTNINATSGGTQPVSGFSGLGGVTGGNVMAGTQATATQPTVTQPTLTNVPATTGTATGTTNTTGNGPANPGPGSWNQEAFLQAHPEILAAWNDPNGGNQEFYGTLDAFVKANVPVLGTSAEQAMFNQSQIGTQGNATQAATPIVTGGGNYSQTQAANQVGEFNTTGNNTQNVGQTTGSATNTAQNTAQNVTGTNQQSTTTNQQQTSGQTTSGTQAQAGTTSTTGTATTTPVDTLGFGQLLQGAATNAQGTDANRTAFLTDVMQNGGTGFQSQMDQAIRNSLTGPQMTGAGDSARARAAGYAAAQTGRHNLDQRMDAAGALAGPTALTSLSGAANPFVGTTQSTTGTQNFSNLLNTSGITNGFSNLAGTQNTSGTNAQNTTGSTTGASSTAGYQNTASAGTENQSGSATGSSSQAAAGQIPTSQQVSTGGGGCIVCTVGLHHKLFRTPRLLRKVVAHKLQRQPERFRHAAAGYFLLFTPIVKRLLTCRLLTRLAMPASKSVVYEELRISGRRLPFRPVPWAIHWTWHWSCWTMGRLFRAKPHVTDPTVLELLHKQKVFFNFGGPSK